MLLSIDKLCSVGNLSDLWSTYSVTVLHKSKLGKTATLVRVNVAFGNYLKYSTKKASTAILLRHPYRVRV